MAAGKDEAWRRLDVPFQHEQVAEFWADALELI